MLLERTYNLQISEQELQQFTSIGSMTHLVVISRDGKGRVKMKQAIPSQ